MKNILFGSVTAAVLLFGMSTGARAQILALSNSLTVYAPDGSVVDFVQADAADGDPGKVFAIPNKELVDPTKVDDPTNVEGTDGTITDLFGVVRVNGSIGLGFRSDAELRESGKVGTKVLGVGNGTLDATPYLHPDLQKKGYHATFRSERAPEPSPLAALAEGLVIVGSLVCVSRCRRISRV